VWGSEGALKLVSWVEQRVNGVLVKDCVMLYFWWVIFEAEIFAEETFKKSAWWISVNSRHKINYKGMLKTLTY